MRRLSLNSRKNRSKELIDVRPKRLARTYRFAATMFAIDAAGPIDSGDLAGGACVEVRRRFMREHPGHALNSWPLPAD